MRSFGASMATTDNNDVKMFHVKHSSLPDAKARENFIQQMLDIHAAH